MATKTKTSETSASEPVPAVETVFSEGLEQFNAGNLVAAGTAFRFVQEEALKQERLGLVRTVRGYLAALEARLQDQTALPTETAEMSAQLLLNQKSPEAALEGLGKALVLQPQRATLHYLKAVAHAQLEQAQEAADALAKAVELDADFLFQFRLEPDFDGLRHSGPFAALLRG